MELYIHIPFCVRKCEYCSFVSFPEKSAKKDEYIDLLLRESRERKEEFTEPVTTVYIGGGTPSLLSAGQLERLVCGIKENVSLEHCVEFSIEANPGTVTDDFLCMAAGLGINRISFGMQAAQARLLNTLGRIHTFRDVQESVYRAKKHKIQNISLDLIFGIPGQTLRDWEESLENAVSLDPFHISAYGLIPEEGTPLYERLAGGEITLPEQELEREMYDLALRKLAGYGYLQYEISNFAKKGYACVHNIGYWTQVPYVGLGISAASMRILKQDENGLECLRRNNPASYQAYMKMVFHRTTEEAEEEIVSPPESRFETVMLALRMNRGISEKRFSELHGVSLDACYGNKLKEMEQKGLMRHEYGAWMLTRRGMDIQNSILVEMMDDL